MLNMRECFIGFVQEEINGDKKQLMESAYFVKEDEDIFWRRPTIVHFGYGADAYKSAEVVMEILEISRTEVNPIFNQIETEPELIGERILKLWGIQRYDVFIAVLEKEILWNFLETFEEFKSRDKINLLSGEVCIAIRPWKERARAYFPSIDRTVYL